MISALTLYSFGKANNFQTDDLTKYYDDNFVTATLLVSMIFTVLVFAANMILLISAAVLYVPLLCYIQGNLKVRRPRTLFGRCLCADLKRHLLAYRSTAVTRSTSGSLS